MTNVGTLPSGLSARKPGERRSSFLNDIGLPSNGTPISCSAICTANELEPGAKYSVNMSQFQPTAEPVVSSLRAKRSNPQGHATRLDCFVATLLAMTAVCMNA